MSVWEEEIAARTFQFGEALERRGFRADGRTLTGRVDDVTVEIVLPNDFPFTPPVVFPPAGFPASWHRERNGAMCLYPADGRDHLPWLDVDGFLSLVTRWILESVSGWTGDFPDLDLERYFPQAADSLIVYGDLDTLRSPYVQLRQTGNVTRVTGHGSIPSRKRAGKGRMFGFVTSIGEPSIPPRTWNELKQLMPAADVRTVDSAVSGGRISYLIVRYSRGGIGAVLTLRVRVGAGGIDLAAVRSASESPATLTLRAGSDAESLSQVRVAVVGVGAIGSFVCDLLSRSGVGQITACDPDILRPGNLIRHLADPDNVGLVKSEAVKRTIDNRPYNTSVITAVRTITPMPDTVMQLFSAHDLIIDASAASGTTQLLAEAATAGGCRLVSVCLQEEGRVVRVDVIPPFEGGPIPPTSLGPTPSRSDLLFEAGCGDPVSTTPAFAVVEAASLAVRHAIGLLTGSPVSDAGAVRDYR